jgi:phosphoribosylformylglycinamidine synthase
MRNDSLQFRCEDAWLTPANTSSPWTRDLDPARAYLVPVSHGEGRYVADEATLDALEDSDRVAFRYATPEGVVTAEANPNGSSRGIAGILNERGNVLGMMPHPERSCEALLGNDDGNALWRSALGLVAPSAAT